MAISLDYARAQEEMMRRRHWEEQQRQMMNAGAYYDMNREMFVVPREQAVGKEVPKLVPSTASDPLAFMDNKANKVLLTQGEM
jgi:hypothetical protein